MKKYILIISVLLVAVFSMISCEKVEGNLSGAMIDDNNCVDLIVISYNEGSKSALIKYVRSALNCNLAKAKQFAEELPKELFTAISYEDARIHAGELKQIGVQVEIILDSGEEAIDKEGQYDVIMHDIDADQKVKTIQYVRDLLGLDMAQGKDLVETLPQTLCEKVSGEEALKIKKDLKEMGAIIELKECR